VGEGRGGPIARESSAALLAGGAVVLGILLQFTNGSVPPGFMSRAMAALSVAGLLTAAGCLDLAPITSTRLQEHRVARWLGGALLLQLALMLVKPPALSLPAGDRSWMWPFGAGLAIVAVASWLALRDWARFGRWLMPAAVLVFVALGVWVIRHTPDPGIDVVVFHREALGALSHGQNPYAITMPMVYGNMDYYGAGLVENGRLLIGLPYPPLGLLLEWPVWAVTGDYRYALLIALAVTAVLLARTHRGPLASVAAVLLLFTPRSFFVVEQGWTEPFVAVALAGVVISVIRRPAWLPIALGALFAMKQYTMCFVPLVFFLVPITEPRRALGVIAKALLVAAIVTLPFAMWNWPGFYRSVIEFQVLQPFRPESLSFLAWYARITGAQLPAWVGFVAMASAFGLVIWKAPRTPAGFAAGGGLMLFALFAFNKQAFCNYYFVVIAALWCAVAATSARAE
jgi:hypothetical protein